MTAQPDGTPTITEAERRRALGEVYSFLLSLAAKRRAQTTDPAPTEVSYRHADHDIRHARGA